MLNITAKPHYSDINIFGVLLIFTCPNVQILGSKLEFH